MNNPMLYQAGGALAILAFLVFLFFCARTWRIWHVIFTFLVFATAIAFVILSSMTLKTRHTWKTREEQLSTQLETLEKDLELLVHGDLQEVRQTTDSIRSLRGKLERALVDRGRVWRNCTPTALNNGVITLSTFTPDPADPPDAAANADNGIVPKTTVYGFQEVQAADGSEPWLLYVGEFTAEAATPTTVSLKPLTPPDPVQVDAMKNAQNTKWSLYEMIPRDGHRAFAEDRDYRPDLGKVGEPLFGAMEADLIEETFDRPQRRYLAYLQSRVQQAPAEEKQRAQAVLDAAQAAFDATEQAYQQDGTVTDEGSRPVEDIWVKVRFLQDFTVDVDAQTNLGAVNSKDYFDSEGRAQVADLQRGERDEDGNFQPADAEFEADDTAVFHKEMADQLIADGVCQEVDSVYVRKLNDFDYSFRYHVERMVELRRDIEMFERDIAVITDANAELQLQVDARTAEKGKLQDDKTAVDKELAAVTAYRDQLKAAEAAVRQRLSLLYRSNRELAEKLRKVHAQILANARQRRAAEALAGQ